MILVNGPRALYINPGCIKRILGMSVSAGNNSFLLFHSFYVFKTKYQLILQFYLKVFLIVSYLTIH